ncbi:Ribosomal RNA small subunit methyltransferase E [[Actinomadura] parvosata subsp. kistnae]|uniref:Ribosomal RNA small subunit methyltransferase E n=2 Tax=Nonomuraea TaxID=83681 RepID=A0A1V0A682_9ACTN|nr:16S rRNA (uracil(1498)-N(3))-methyltransferase [Nonomuraea sp. ATCC 55076]AQZ65679.1 16S rRNA (uracil(1498)-N(3))-methyltransferase [Nonomuraea sp. ATCC 55076]NJP89904.1 16S rRNA (uracil(1498)-N(3))-methyltransferase [Nonomuraea sp. FMUSA5-5]SPL97075.1 Ribosomal RNA small subunit methyltransferase E [Actinomadura parvosata subsp. kistnae]
MTVPVFLAQGLDGPELTLDGPEGRHAASVRRLRPGERVDLTDGAGAVAECVVRETLKDALRLDVLRRYDVEPPRPRLVVVQGLPKGDRGELAVEMMTEAGVDVIVPWAAARSITQWKGDKVAKALGRWRSTAREAGKQARRFHLPEVADLATTKQVERLLSEAALGLVLHEEAAEPLSGVPLPAGGDIVMVVGPEGGVSEEELAAFRAAKATAVLLGPTVLRTSTAGVAAAAVLLSRTGRW